MYKRPRGKCAECEAEISPGAQRCAQHSTGGHTPEQRDGHALCGAKKKDGSSCRAFAGQATDHLGVGPCKFHGGATTAHRKHAVALEAKKRLVTLGQPLDRIAPAEALLGLLRATAGHVNWLREQIMELDDLGTQEAAVLLRMYDDERDRLTRISEAAIRSGASAEEVRVQQAQARQLVDIVRAASNDVGLSKRQQQALGVALRKHAASLSDDPQRSAQQAAEADARLAKLREEISAEEEHRVERAAAMRPPADLAYPPSEWMPQDPAAAA